jgi:hypothetical protein
LIGFSCLAELAELAHLYSLALVEGVDCYWLAGGSKAAASTLQARTSKARMVTLGSQGKPSFHSQIAPKVWEQPVASRCSRSSSFAKLCLFLLPLTTTSTSHRRIISNLNQNAWLHQDPCQVSLHEVGRKEATSWD